MFWMQMMFDGGIDFYQQIGIFGVYLVCVCNLYGKQKNVYDLWGCVCGLLFCFQKNVIFGFCKLYVVFFFCNVCDFFYQDGGDVFVGKVFEELLFCYFQKIFF